MAEKLYSDSNYKFTDPIRYFKANDPYYFEVDNIPLKQLHENCLWLKDQLNKGVESLVNVKRGDIEELKPYATGGDRTVRVKPGRYTARINDASVKQPLAFLQKLTGNEVGEVDLYEAAVPGPSDPFDPFPGNASEVLEDILEQFKSVISSNSVGMTGLAEKAFTWPVHTPNNPIDNDGVDLTTAENGTLTFSNTNSPGYNVFFAPLVIANALLWQKSQAGNDGFTLKTSDPFSDNYGMSLLPLTENYFIKKWRGVSRLAIVDVDEELTIEVPEFDQNDFSYIDENGNETLVENFQTRIDLVFIYSKPVDTSAVNILTPTQKKKITKPELGIIRGAGIKMNFGSNSTGDPKKEYLGNEIKMLASPGDQTNTNLGFTATSENDLTVDIRGSFPAPDDILNLAPLISEKLESEAYELVGQSILPVAYVFVQNGSQLVNSDDIVDIRPLFRTAELTYNERAGIAAAFPQLSLANPAVGKAELKYELKRVVNDLLDPTGDINFFEHNTGIIATGYVHGGFNFGPEGALFDFYKNQFGVTDPNDGGVINVLNHIVNKYSYYGATNLLGTAVGLNIPYFPDWDLARWAEGLDSYGTYSNDYITTFVSEESIGSSDTSIVAGSVKGQGNTYGQGYAPGYGGQLSNFENMDYSLNQGAGVTQANFSYVSKTIKFDRPEFMLDYIVDVDLINCIPATSTRPTNNSGNRAGRYSGIWVEKGYDEFTIFVAFATPDNQGKVAQQLAPFPAPVAIDGTVYVERGGERFSSWIVPVKDVLYSNTNSIQLNSDKGYSGNPRVAKCTLPTVMWKLTCIPQKDFAYHHANLNNTEPTILTKTKSPE